MVRCSCIDDDKKRCSLDAIKGSRFCTKHQTCKSLATLTLEQKFEVFWSILNESPYDLNDDLQQCLKFNLEIVNYLIATEIDLNNFIDEVKECYNSLPDEVITYIKMALRKSGISPITNFSKKFDAFWTELNKCPYEIGVLLYCFEVVLEEYDDKSTPFEKIWEDLNECYTENSVPPVLIPLIQSALKIAGFTSIIFTSESSKFTGESPKFTIFWQHFSKYPTNIESLRTCFETVLKSYEENEILIDTVESFNDFWSNLDECDDNKELKGEMVPFLQSALLGSEFSSSLQFSEQFETFWILLTNATPMADEMKPYFNHAFEMAGYEENLTDDEGFFELFWNELPQDTYNFPSKLKSQLKSIIEILIDNESSGSKSGQDPEVTDDATTVPDPYCEKLGILDWSSNSCYIDSALVALLLTDNSYINTTLLNADLSKIKYTIKKGGKDETSFSLIDYKELFDITRKIQTDLREIKNDLTTNKEIKTCTLLRQHLVEHEKLYQKFINPNLVSIEFKSTQFEPLDVIIRLGVIFELPDPMILTKVVSATNVNPKIAMKEDYVTSVTDTPVPFTININKDFIKKSSTEVSLETFLNSEESEELASNSLYQPDSKKPVYYKYITITETRSNNPPLIHFNLQRRGPIGFEHNGPREKVTNRVRPPATIKLGRTLELNSIIVHHGGASGGHYTTFIRCRGQWYHYNDMGNTNGKKIEFIGSFARLLSGKTGKIILENATNYFYF
jgi:hypothetical protein